MSRLVTALVFVLVLVQAAVGLRFLAQRATSASLHDRQVALTASADARIELSLEETAPLWRALERTLEPTREAALPTVVYLFPSQGLPQDLGQLKLWQRRLATPLTALLQPAVVRLMLPNLDPGPLVGDEALFLVEVGPHVPRPFMATLDELESGNGFRIYRLPRKAVQ